MKSYVWTGDVQPHQILTELSFSLVQYGTTKKAIIFLFSIIFMNKFYEVEDRKFSPNGHQQHFVLLLDNGLQ